MTAAFDPAGGTRPPKQEQLPASSEVHEVGPGVLRLQLPIAFTGLGHVNCYALLDDKGAAIVDAGLPGRDNWRALVARLAAAGLAVGDVHTVFVTHSHPDHFGGAGRLAEEAGARLVTERSFRTWFSGSRPGRSFETPWGGSPIPHLRRHLWTARLGRWHLLAYARPPVPSGTVSAGEQVRLAGRDWEVLHTPGHTGDHVCLFDPEAGLLVSGDHVLPTITPHVAGLSTLSDPLGTYLESLESLRRLGDITTVLPAHGHPFADLQGRIDDIVGHHDDRLAHLRRIGEELGPATVVDFSQHLFRPAVWGMMAESETYAHLEYLRLRGEAECSESAGRLLYRIVGEATPAGS